jgi:hypothetical protein
VIITNCNYPDLVGAAISSALAIDWPDKKVIVNDDTSRDAIDGFRGKVAAYFRPKILSILGTSSSSSTYTRDGIILAPRIGQRLFPRLRA